MEVGTEGGNMTTTSAFGSESEALWRNEGDRWIAMPGKEVPPTPYVSPEVQKRLLREVAEKYRVPEPEQVQVLRRRTKSGHLDLRYTSHATIRTILNEVDPLWTVEFVSDANGVPITVERNGMLTAYGHLTFLGKRVFGVASVESDKSDWAKELLGDLLRNCAMSLGIHLSLWMKDFPGQFPRSEADKAKAPDLEEALAKARETRHRRVGQQVAQAHAIVPEPEKAPEALVSPVGVDVPTASSEAVSEASEPSQGDALKLATQVAEEHLGAVNANPLCGSQPQRFANWTPVPGCGLQVEEVDERVVRLTKTFLCNSCTEKWRASTGAQVKEEQKA